MKQQYELVAEKRRDAGKGASRRLRRAGKVPAILYGAGQAPVSIQLEHAPLALAAQHEGFYSHILTLKLNGGVERVVLRDMQRHPFRPIIMHLDLQRVSEDELLTMRVPVHFLNEDKCVGVKLGGGLISRLMTEIEIVCLPKDLPEFIEVDVAGLALGHSIHINEVKVPEGVKIASLLHGGDPSQPVVAVHAPRAVEEEVPAAVAAEGVVAEAAPEAAAPEAESES
jgi:large subunit ribosomal protein L25